MANNFRTVGDFYISKGGHDSNDGLTASSPKKSLPSSLIANTDYVIGAGVYGLNFTSNLAGIKIFGDGSVFFRSTQGGSVTQQSGAAVDTTIEKVSFDNYTFNYIGNAPHTFFIDCLLSNCIFASTANQSNPIYANVFITSKIINCSYSGNHAGTGIEKTILLDSEAGNVSSLKDSYVDFQSVLTTRANILLPSNVRSNNIQGIFVLQGVLYAIQDQFTGTPQDNGYASGVYWLNEANLTANGYTGTIVGWDAAVATCINRDPKFNNASKLDFTLQADSPHIGRASDGFSNIGGTEYAQSFYAGISNPNILLFETSEAIDTTTNNNDWRLKPGYNEGWIRAIIKVSNNDVQISSIPYIGNYSFDSDQAGGSSTNMNVPDSKPVTNEYPNYLTVTTQAANDTTLIIAGHGAVVGDWLWVDGQYREITGVPDADTVTFATSLRAIVAVGTVVKIGTFESLASLNPNRLNMKMRSSKLADVNASNWDNPLTWDNDGLSPAGQYMAQEWNNAPMIDSLNEVGFGDDNYDANYGNPINLKVVDIMIYLRNNYRS